MSGGLCDRGITDADPALEALPAKLLRGADLVGKAETIHVADLARLPLAIPLKVEPVLVTGGVGGHQQAAEVGAPAHRTQGYAVQLELRLCVQELRNDTLHLDARTAGPGADPVCSLANAEGGQVGAERTRGAGAGEEIIKVGKRHTVKGNRSGLVSFCE